MLSIASGYSLTRAAGTSCAEGQPRQLAGFEQHAHGMVVAKQADKPWHATPRVIAIAEMRHISKCNSSSSSFATWVTDYNTVRDKATDTSYKRADGKPCTVFSNAWGSKEPSDTQPR